MRSERGSAGDFDYRSSARLYRRRRQPDPGIERMIDAELGRARTVLNVGAGTGSYEPRRRFVLAVEPTPAMRRQRPAELAPAIDARAELLPFDAGSFDAAMAALTIHHWPDLARGLAELRRVSRGPVVILTFDPAALGELWLARYFPEVIALEQRRFPALERLADLLGGEVSVKPVPVARECPDGFGEAYYARPEALLEPDVRRAMSGFGLTDSVLVRQGVYRLAEDLQSGQWDQLFGHLRRRPWHSGAVRLVVARPE